ncbi:methionyl aminopeptidase [Lipingzhangella halophila]|uniref:Methionine aminopeptidase n=1 Tax=Lipingzhangella halophila TaxID=1783352 RepID=A0A7W7RPJ2_9ACTN|nr:type I methionyl aminopeptidase [Lipingzhangella halophila]MBB4935216.1 methionyl aminopeptidase [Lipingzhangella halophila]
MVELKTPGEIDAMRAAGRIVARALAAVRERAAPGVQLRELDETAAKVIADAGAEPLFLGYHPDWAPIPFPGTICASVNDAVLHGIPTDLRLRDGDLVSVDCGARLHGWCGDAATTFVVGTAGPADTALIEAGERALRAGIKAARPGNTIGDIAAAIAGVARGAGYGILDDQGGHGIGHEMHEAPYVPNEGRAGRGMKLRPGLVVAIEPVLTGGDDAAWTAPDGWTVHAADGSRSTHCEHTVAVTTSGPRVLTLQ